MQNYILNDPTTPNLIVPKEFPVKETKGMNFKIFGFEGDKPDLAIDSVAHQAACCHITMVNAINVVNRYLTTPLKKWAMTRQLRIFPQAGKQLNAYYDRQNLKFFYSQDPVTRRTVYAVNSYDVVAHELGHAILDTIRPDLYNLQSMEVWAFHESFGDIHALINILHYDEIINYVLEETSGDLGKPNIVTKLAEEMGNAVFHVTGGRMGHTIGFLRNAVNPYLYVEPEKLPRQSMDNALSSEPHNFSRVFTGVWWDILNNIYKQNLKTVDAKTALKQAVETLSMYTFRCLPLASARVRFFDAVAKAMLVIDKANNYKYNEIMNHVFLERKILQQSIRPMVAINWELFVGMIDSSKDFVLKTENVKAVCSKSSQAIPLPHFMITAEVPGDTFYEFDNNGNCVEVLADTAEEVVEHAHDCVDFLKSNGLIRSDKMAPFEITEEGELVRSHFSCDCNFFNNATNPEAPEYQKGYKAENTYGCGCGSNSSNDPCDSTTQLTNIYCNSSGERVVRYKNTR